MHLLRIILILELLLVAAIGAYHRIRSEATREKLNRRQEGLFILVALRLLGLTTWIAIVIWMVNPAAMAWAFVALPEWMRWVGVALVLVAVAMLFWTLRTLGKNLTDTVVTRTNHTLVREGPYRWVRHPFYCTASLLVIGTSLAAANWFILLTGSLVIMMLALRTRKEEELLIARFGDEYRDYVRTTGQFWPRHFR